MLSCLWAFRDHIDVRVFIKGFQRRLGTIKGLAAGVRRSGTPMASGPTEWFGFVELDKGGSHDCTTLLQHWQADF